MNGGGGCGDGEKGGKFGDGGKGTGSDNKTHEEIASFIETLETLTEAFSGVARFLILEGHDGVLHVISHT